MFHGNREHHRLKRERIRSKVRYYVRKMRKTLHWERIRTRQEEKMPCFTNGNSHNVRSPQEPHGELYRCSANFLFGDEYEQESKDTNRGDLQSEHQDEFRSRAVPIPDSLKLFDTNGIEHNSGLPPFLHFGPLTKSHPSGKNEDVNSNTNHSSIISRDFLYNTASTDNKSFIFTPMNDYWEDYGNRDKYFFPRRNSSKNIHRGL